VPEYYTSLAYNKLIIISYITHYNKLIIIILGCKWVRSRLPTSGPELVIVLDLLLLRWSSAAPLLRALTAGPTQQHAPAESLLLLDLLVVG